ncbi:alpha/beta hydrolase [Segetibacter koreensis]|uniref:alpha/beta hydrolase n=1 Tax=Segetibacter koreensis TaxID=398037 RepID=UPI00037A5299|nr:alpha/beta hydrolase-fold protein [Segetibacter koreensis]
MLEDEVVLNEKTGGIRCVEQRRIYSDYLERDVIVDIYLPISLLGTAEEIELLLINDGQDLRTMNFTSLIDSLLMSKSIRPVLCVGIHCGIDRMNEYGTICSVDYKGRGVKAGLYGKFIFDELLPSIKSEFVISSFKEKSFAGFSLGGLSALDLVWNHAAEFVKAGVFSGSLWWRRKGYEDEGYNDEKDRLMHLQVKKGIFKPGLRFFFECGRLDETADRNNNGIIDSIEDTTDLISALKDLGYTDEQIFYLELEDGRHNVETWKRAFPAFLQWGWGNTE